MRKFSSNIPVKEILSFYSKKLTTREVAKRCNSNQRTVLDVLHAYNIPIRHYDFYRKRKYNINYFENIDSEDKAYFLGLIYADGNNYTKTGMFQISLEEKDSYILQRFIEKINLTDNLKLITPNGKSRNNITSKNNMRLLRITSKKLSKQLLILGVLNKKSLILKFPTKDQVPEHLLSHFIRGYFDGDGSITVGKDYISFSLVSTKEFLEGVRENLVKNCKLNYNKLVNRIKNKNNYSLSYTGFYQLQRIYEYLYKDCDNLYLTRKKEKFESYQPKRAERKTSNQYKLKIFYEENPHLKQERQKRGFYFRKPIKQIKDGKIIKKWDYIQQIKEDGFYPDCASKAAKNGKKYKGYEWSF